MRRNRTLNIHIQVPWVFTWRHKNGWWHSVFSALDNLIYGFFVRMNCLVAQSHLVSVKLLTKWHKASSRKIDHLNQKHYFQQLNQNLNYQSVKSLTERKSNKYISVSSLDPEQMTLTVLDPKCKLHQITKMTFLPNPSLSIISCRKARLRQSSPISMRSYLTQMPFDFNEWYFFSSWNDLMVELELYFWINLGGNAVI